MKRHFITLAILATLAGCSTDNQEDQAREMLNDARISLAAKQYDSARDTLLEMRRRYPRAISVRREAILVLDSIEMQAALDSFMTGDLRYDLEELAVRARFYQRKLQEDANSLKR